MARGDGQESVFGCGWLKMNIPIESRRPPMQDTGAHRDTKDQFYTAPHVAEECVRILRTHTTSTTWVEPSAGTGAFLAFAPTALAYDIDPKHPSIQRANFLDVEIPEGCVVFGNPPFGRQASAAKAFIRHAADRASVIAFILPRSFMKPSMQSAFPMCFHLVHQHELPQGSFLVNDAAYDVPCVFQVWEKRPNERASAAIVSPSGFAFVKSSDPHDIVFRRVGVNAGKCSLPNNQSLQSHYFLKLDDPTIASAVIEKSLVHVFPSNTTGPRSLSKPEATAFLHACIADAGP
jgi:hypothetical protein